jgi:hypothetical protein
MDISVTPNPSLVDEPIHIKISGLQPRQRIKMTASRTARDKTHIFHLASYAEFESDDLGQIDLTRHSPLNGTYEGIDPMGLLWSLEVQRIEPHNNAAIIGQVLEPQPSH